MSDYSDMYNQPDDEEDLVKLQVPAIGSGVKMPVVKGAVTELEIDGKRFELVNPEYVRALQATFTILTTKLQRTERTINTLNGAVRKLNQDVKDLRSKMDRKIDSI